MKLIKLFLTIFVGIVVSNQVWPATGRYRLTLRDNPATTAVVGWDQISGSNPIVYYGTTDQGTNWNAYPNSKAVDRSVSDKGMNNNFVRLTGLSPNTAYYFVIKDSEGVSNRFWFKTAPNVATERLSFVSGGDSRNNRAPRVNANKLVAKLRPHAVLFGGDMTSSGTNSEWQDWFDDWQYSIGTDGRIIPFVATRGNHESSNSIIYNLFDVPSPDVYYALTFGGSLVRTYTLNTEISISGTQTDWLGNDLQNNASVTWKMAQYHKPMRPHVASKTEGNHQYNNWAPLFYQHQVNLVVECDAHTVKTTWPIRPYTGLGSDEGFVRDDENGTVYVGEGCWGAPLRTNDDDKEWTRNSGMFNQFKWIFVGQDKIEVRTIKVDNADQVGTVNDNDIFSPPANLDIWAPSNGSVVTITKSSGGGGGTYSKSWKVSASMDDVEESEGTGSIYTNSSDLELVYDSYQSSGNQTVGMLFRNVDIPQGATIASAYIQFTVDETGSSATSLIIKGEGADNAADFNTNSYNVSNRVATSASVSWAPSAWNVVGEAGTGQKTPDISSIIQEIVDRPGWNSGNKLVMVITGSGTRTAESYDGSSSDAPKLYVDYTEGPSGGGGGSGPIVASSRVASSADDAEEAASGSMYLNSSDLELVYDSYQSAGNQKVGMRFINLGIPQGAVIKSTYIQFTVDEAVNAAGPLTIKGENADNSTSFTSSTNNIGSRPTTSASVSWSPASWNTVGEAGAAQKTPDLTSIVQEIVNRSGWTSSSALSIIITGSGKRVAESYDGSSGQAPLLVVEYEGPGTSSRVTDVQSIQNNVAKDYFTELYPVPVKDGLHIDMVHGDNVALTVYDLRGQKILSMQLKDVFNRIDTENWKPGQYIIVLQSGTKVIERKSIIKY